MKELLERPKELAVAARVLEPQGQALAILEGPTGCNRAGTCDYCTVPLRWDAEKASTLEQTFNQIDWIYDQGFRVLGYVGGEPLTPFFKTKEGITFREHTLEVVKYASAKGMLVNVTTNGDYVDRNILKQLKKAGLDTLTFSLHSISDAGIEKILKGARMAAEEKIPPIVSVVFTSERTGSIPKIAEKCAENGIIFATTIVQEYGGGFSATQTESKIPSVEQQREVFEKLKKLKQAGFIRNNMNYLEHAVDFPNNSWKCDPNRDKSISVRGEGQGKILVCSEVNTDYQIGEINLKDEKWRTHKQELVHNCKNCLYSCTFESQNPNLKGDNEMLVVMGLIKSGHAELVRDLGYRVAKSTPSLPYPLPKDIKLGVSELENYYKENPIVLFLSKQKLKRVTHPDLKVNSVKNLADVAAAFGAIYWVSNSLKYAAIAAAITVSYKALTEKTYPYTREIVFRLFKNKEKQKQK